MDDNWDYIYRLSLKASGQMINAPNWKVVFVKGHFNRGKWIPPHFRQAPNTVKSGAVSIGYLAGPVIQAAEDWHRDDISGSQKIGRYSLSVLEAAVPIIGAADLGASLLFGDEKVDQFKSDIFSNKNPIIDKLSDGIVNIGGERFQEWSSKPHWLDFF